MPIYFGPLVITDHQLTIKTIPSEQALSSEDDVWHNTTAIHDNSEHLAPVKQFCYNIDFMANGRFRGYQTAF